MPVVDGSSIRNFDPVPNGTYDAELESYENKQAGTDGSDMVLLTFRLTDDENEGKKQFANRSLKPDALWAFKKTCVALGADPELFVGEFDTDEILDELIGNPCRLKVSIQEGGDYAGRNRVDDVLAPSYSLA